LKNAPYLTLLLFIGLSVSLRLGSFFPSVIDHDESTYIVIADAMLQGNIYQVDYIDTKPIGIFLIYALIQFLFGSSIVMMRLTAALVIGGTSFLLYKAKRQAGSSHYASLAAGMIYIFINSIYTYWGVSPNTETYFNFFTAIALWLYLRQGPLWHYAIAGLSLGLGFILKYIVLFDGLAFGLFLLWMAWQQKLSWAKAWSRSLLMAACAALPFMAVLLYYQQMGYLEEFWFYTFTVSSRYPSSPPLLDYLAFAGEFFLRYLPVMVFFLIVLFKLNKTAYQHSWTLGIIWSTLTLFSVLIPGNPFGHYFIQFMLPLSFMAGEFFALPIEKLPAWIRWLRRPKIGYTLFAVLLIVLWSLQRKDYVTPTDYPKVAAEYLNDNLQPGEQIYTDENQIIYYLTDRLPLIRYVHPSLFWVNKHIIAMEIPLDDEIARIEEAKPRFLVFRFPLEEGRFHYFRKKYYQPVKTIDDFCIIFERLPESKIKE